jgi:hypothetical protein
MSVGLEPEPEPEPESPPQLRVQQQQQTRPEQGKYSATVTAETPKDLVDDAIETQLRRSRVALDKKDDPVAQRRALCYLARARDLARSQARLGQGSTELHALALLRFVEEASASPQAAVAEPDIGVIDAQSLVALCEEALTQLESSGESNQMLEGRCLRELSRLLFELPPECMDREVIDRAMEARRASSRLIAQAEAQLAALVAVHELESKPCDVVPEEFGFSAAEQTLVRLIAQSGAADWNSIASKMSDAGGSWSASETESLWKAVEPRVRAMLESNPTMGCGHSCSNCPTKDTCKLHDSVQPLPDLEDL